MTAEYLIALGEFADIKSPKFGECVKNLNYKEWVNNVAASGGEKNINSTPTVFINGKEIRRGTSGTDLGEYFDAAAFVKAVEGK